MADQKVTDLTQITGRVATDLLYLVDDPSGTAVSKSIDVSALLADQGHGELAITSGSGTQALSASTWTEIDQWEGGGSHLLNTSVPSPLTGLQIDAAGYWLVNWSVCFTTAHSAATDFTVRPYWNATAQDNGGSIVTASSGSGKVVLSGQTIVDVTSTGANMSLYVHATNACDFDIKYANLTATKINQT